MSGSINILVNELCKLPKVFVGLSSSTTVVSLLRLESTLIRY